jgi:hypothetical protein
LQEELASSKKQGHLIFTALTTHQTPTFKVMQRYFMHYKDIFRTPVFVSVALLSLKRLCAEGFLLGTLKGILRLSNWHLFAQGPSFWETWRDTFLRAFEINRYSVRQK